MAIQMTRAEYEKKYGVKPAATPISQVDTTPAIPKMTRAEYQAKYAFQPKPNYVQRVGADFSQIGQDIVSGIQESAKTIETGSPLEAAGGAIRAGLRTVGGVARGAFTPIFEAPGIKQLTEKVAETITSIPEARNLISWATDLAKKNPQAAKDLQNVVDIATLGLGGAFEKPLIREAGAIGKDISAGTKALLTPSEEAIQKKVLALFQKSIKPTAKKTLAQGEKYNLDTLNALRTIKANTDKLNIEDVTGEIITGRAPQTINELAQGLDQTKKIVFNQYDELAKNAGTAGATIDAKPIADEVAKVAQNKALQLTNPSIIDYAKGWEERLRGFDVLDAETTQEVIKLMNTNLQAFYRNPTYDAASKVTIDAGIANNFRQALDKAIESATGEQYQILKRQYGALKAIENDVVRAAMRDARKNTKGLLDYTDIFTGGQMVGGILSLNPAMFTKGAIERGFKEYIKFLNDPNRAIGNIFEKLDIDTTKAFEPVSMTGKALKNPSIGMTIQDVTKTQEFQRLQSINKSTQKTTNNTKKNITPDTTITASIKQAKASGQSFDEWVKGQEEIGRARYRAAATKLREASDIDNDAMFNAAKKEMGEAEKLFRGNARSLLKQRGIK